MVNGRTRTVTLIEDAPSVGAMAMVKIVFRVVECGVGGCGRGSGRVYTGASTERAKIMSAKLESTVLEQLACAEGDTLQLTTNSNTKRRRMIVFEQ